MSEDIEKEGKQVPSIRKSEETAVISGERTSRTNKGVEKNSEEERELAGEDEEK